MWVNKLVSITPFTNYMYGLHYYLYDLPRIIDENTLGKPKEKDFMQHKCNTGSQLKKKDVK